MSETPRQHAVENGVIRHLSVSQIESFDPSTPFGCNRKWFFNKVLHVPDPGDAARDGGIQLHKEIELYLKTGAMALGKVALAGKHHIEEVRPFVRSVEHELQPGELDLLGIPLQGKIDIVAERPDGPELLDWKTTSDIGRWAKTQGQLRNSTQMLGYAQWYLRKYPGYYGLVRLSHVYFQTRGRRSEKVSCQVDPENVLAGWTRTGALVSMMVDVAKERDPEKVSPNRAVCDVGKGCPYRAICPRSASEQHDLFEVFGPSLSGASTMSLFDTFLGSSKPPTAAPPPSGASEAKTPAAVGTGPVAAGGSPPSHPPPLRVGDMIGDQKIVGFSEPGHVPVLASAGSRMAIDDKSAAAPPSGEPPRCDACGEPATVPHKRGCARDTTIIGSNLVAVRECEMGQKYLLDEKGTVGEFTGTAKSHGFFQVGGAQGFVRLADSVLVTAQSPAGLVPSQGNPRQSAGEAGGAGTSPASNAEAPKRRGRPPGSKNRKIEDPAPERSAVMAAAEAMRRAMLENPPPFQESSNVDVQGTAIHNAVQARKASEPPNLNTVTPTIIRVTVRHGVTLNMGNYQSAKVEVEMEATGIDSEVFRTALGEKVRAAVHDESKTYLAKRAEPAKESAA